MRSALRIPDVGRSDHPEAFVAQFEEVVVAFKPLIRCSQSKDQELKLYFLALSLRSTRSDKPILKWRPGSGNRDPEAETASQKRKPSSGRRNRVKTIVL